MRKKQEEAIAKAAAEAAAKAAAEVAERAEVDAEEYLIQQLRNFLHDQLDVWVFPYHFPDNERCKDAIQQIFMALEDHRLDDRACIDKIVDIMLILGVITTRHFNPDEPTKAERPDVDAEAPARREDPKHDARRNHVTLRWNG